MVCSVLLFEIRTNEVAIFQVELPILLTTKELQHVFSFTTRKIAHLKNSIQARNEQ